jgi:hypothetical protein
MGIDFYIRKEVDMGRVKELSIWLAESVYIHHWSDEEIMNTLAKLYPDIQQARIDNWLREQIQVVRENPKLYQSMFN